MHMPHGITVLRCYLPPGRDDVPAFTPARLVLDLLLLLLLLYYFYYYYYYYYYYYGGSVAEWLSC